MDVEENAEGGGAEALARDFCRLGVDERSELVARMIEALDERIGPQLAEFYLDMTDWNLHSAIGFYLEEETEVEPPKRPEQRPQATDFESFRKYMNHVVPSMTAEPAETVVTAAPGAVVRWTWKVANDNLCFWPFGCTFQPVPHPDDSPHLHFGDEIKVRPLNPGEHYDLTVTVRAPEVEGEHRRHFRLISNHKEPFGDPLWMCIVVRADGPSPENRPDADFNMC